MLASRVVKRCTRCGQIAKDAYQEVCSRCGGERWEAASNVIIKGGAGQPALPSQGGKD